MEKVDKNMKIGLVLSAVPGYSETFFRNKIKGLQKNGAEVILFVNNPPKKNDIIPCQIVVAPKLNGSKIQIILNSLMELFKAVFRNLKKSIALFQIERKAKRSLGQAIRSVIANQYILSQKVNWLHFGFGTAALGRENVAQAIGAKMAVSFRGFDIGIYPLKNPGCFDLLFSKVDKIHVISNDLKALLHQNRLPEEVKTQKITPAINSSFFSANKQRTNTETITIVTLARLHWKKGLEYTLQSLALLKQEGIGFHYTIIGEGPERERLAFAAYQLGISEQVAFTGKLSSEEVKRQLEKSAVYLQYSIQEGFCNAVLEAQAMGLLCIVSNAEGLSENVIDGQTGWVIPKRNPEALALKIKEIIAMPENQKDLYRKQAIERVQHQFSLEKQESEFLSFYEINPVKSKQ